MRRPEFIALLDDFKAQNGEATDFTISVSDSEARAAVMTLKYLVADGTIEDFTRHEAPKDKYFDIVGYYGDE